MSKHLIAFSSPNNNYTIVTNIIDTLSLNEEKVRINPGTFIVDTDETTQAIHEFVTRGCYESVLEELNKLSSDYMRNSGEPMTPDEIEELRSNAMKTAMERYRIVVLPADSYPT